MTFDQGLSSDQAEHYITLVPRRVSSSSAKLSASSVHTLHALSLLTAHQKIDLS